MQCLLRKPSRITSQGHKTTGWKRLRHIRYDDHVARGSSIFNKSPLARGEVQGLGRVTSVFQARGGSRCLVPTSQGIVVPPKRPHFRPSAPPGRVVPVWFSNTNIRLSRTFFVHDGPRWWSRRSGTEHVSQSANCLARDIGRKSRKIVALQEVKGAHLENMYRVTTGPAGHDPRKLIQRVQEKHSMLVMFDARANSSQWGFCSTVTQSTRGWGLPAKWGQIWILAFEGGTVVMMICSTNFGANTGWLVSRLSGRWPVSSKRPLIALQSVAEEHHKYWDRILWLLPLNIRCLLRNISGFDRLHNLSPWRAQKKIQQGAHLIVRHTRCYPIKIQDDQLPVAEWKML
jgi:hypothetical protein